MLVSTLSGAESDSSVSSDTSAAAGPAPASNDIKAIVAAEGTDLTRGFPVIAFIFRLLSRFCVVGN